MSDREDISTDSENFAVDELLEAGVALNSEDNMKTMFYLVKWAGSYESENTWEPESNINTKECIREFWGAVGIRKPAVSKCTVGYHWKPDKKTKKGKRTTLAEQSNASKKRRTSSPGVSSSKERGQAEVTKTGHRKKRSKKAAPPISTAFLSDDSDVEVIETSKSPAEKSEGKRREDVRREQFLERKEQAYQQKRSEDAQNKAELEAKRNENEIAIKNGSRVPNIRKESKKKIQTVDTSWNITDGNHKSANMSACEKTGSMLPKLKMKTRSSRESEQETLKLAPAPPPNPSVSYSGIRPSGIRTSYSGHARRELTHPTRGEKQYPGPKPLFHPNQPQVNTPRSVESAYTPHVRPHPADQVKELDGKSQLNSHDSSPDSGHLRETHLLEDDDNLYNQPELTASNTLSAGAKSRWGEGQQNSAPAPAFDADELSSSPAERFQARNNPQKDPRKRQQMLAPTKTAQRQSQQPQQPPPAPQQTSAPRLTEAEPEAFFRDDENDRGDDGEVKNSTPPPLSQNRPAVYTKSIPSNALWKGLMYAHQKKVGQVGLVDVTGGYKNDDMRPSVNMRGSLKFLQELKLSCFVDVQSFQKHVKQVDQIVEVISPDQSMRAFVREMVQCDKIGIYQLDNNGDKDDKDADGGAEKLEKGEVMKTAIAPIRLIAFAPAKIPDLRVFYNLPKENQIFALLVTTSSSVKNHFERIKKWERESVKEKAELELTETKKREEAEGKHSDEDLGADQTAVEIGDSAVSLDTSAHKSLQGTVGEAQQEPAGTTNEDAVTAETTTNDAPLSARPSYQSAPQQPPQPAPAPVDPRLARRQAVKSEATAPTKPDKANKEPSNSKKLENIAKFKAFLKFSSSKMRKRGIDGERYRISAPPFVSSESDKLRSILEYHKCEEATGPYTEAVKGATLRFIHLQQILYVPTMPDIVQARCNKAIKFFLFGIHEKVSKKLWKVNEIYRSGGLVTFTSRALFRDTEKVIELLDLFGSVREQNAYWQAFVLDDVYKEAVNKLKDATSKNFEKQSEENRLRLLRGLFKPNGKLKSIAQLPESSTEPVKDKQYAFANISRKKGQFDGDSILANFQSRLPEGETNPDIWLLEEMNRIQYHVDIRVTYRRYIVIDVEGTNFDSDYNSIEKQACSSFVDEIKRGTLVT